ncbi:MAG: hypothetical protein KKF65_03310 [Nanoarchaeota archaeon]|nr:hypothetical protein [Nanoarchaeota archaeon]
MSQLIELKNISVESKVSLLKELGYDSDGTHVVDENGRKVLDKYLDQPILVKNMLILPGSTIILDNNPLSIALYMEEYEDVI